jgi:glycosyltransferase involved in cell wall biosynthesis
VLDAEEVRRRATTSVGGGLRAGWHRAVPTVAKTFAKDVREARRARRFQIDPRGPWTSAERRIEFVWQRHELFHTAGLDLATSLAVPSVLFVPALVVWQAEQWGVRRPGWGSMLERQGELPALRRATLVACGTDLVAEQVARRGVDETRLLVTPTGVDADVFGVAHDREAVRRDLGVDGFVVAWSGSFRPFHSLDHLIEAAANVDGLTLLLIGDGPERPRIEALARERRVPTRSTGLVPHAKIPRLLAAADVGVVLARSAQSFHYSPLKVVEYLASGIPVVAPEVAELRERVVAGINGAVYAPGDAADLARVLRALAAEPGEVARLAASAHATRDDWTWDHQIRRVRSTLRGR